MHFFYNEPKCILITMRLYLENYRVINIFVTFYNSFLNLSSCKTSPSRIMDHMCLEYNIELHLPMDLKRHNHIILIWKCSWEKLTTYDKVVKAISYIIFIPWVQSNHWFYHYTIHIRLCWMNGVFFGVCISW